MSLCKHSAILVARIVLNVAPGTRRQMGCRVSSARPADKPARPEIRAICARQDCIRKTESCAVGVLWCIDPTSTAPAATHARLTRLGRMALSVCHVDWARNTTLLVAIAQSALLQDCFPTTGFYAGRVTRAQGRC